MGKTTVIQLQSWYLDLQELIKYFSSAKVHLLLVTCYQVGVFALQEPQLGSWCFNGINPFWCWHIASHFDTHTSLNENAAEVLIGWHPLVGISGCLLTFDYSSIADQARS